mmetsp:Transcript_28750/g.42252  ORF Transcript_28750/g.42252 Transcript_28750/m.42252 type:complete len:211 (+) Transcript_28750:194-826(+)
MCVMVFFPSWPRIQRCSATPRDVCTSEASRFTHSMFTTAHANVILCNSESSPLFSAHSLSSKTLDRPICLSRGTARGDLDMQLIAPTATSCRRERFLCKTKPWISASASLLCATMYAASWLEAAQFFSATTVVSCSSSNPLARQLIRAFINPACLTMISAPSAELAPQFPIVIPAYKRAFLWPGRIGSHSRTIASASRDPGVEGIKKEFC